MEGGERCEGGCHHTQGVVTPWVARLTTAFAWWASGDVWATPMKFHAIGRSFGLGLGSFSPHDWVLIGLNNRFSPPRIFCFAQYGGKLCFFVHFECIFYVFHECPPANGQTPKLVEIVSSKALYLSLVFILAVFI